MSNKHPNYGGIEKNAVVVAHDHEHELEHEEDAHDVETQRLGSGRRDKRDSTNTRSTKDEEQHLVPFTIQMESSDPSNTDLTPKQNQRRRSSSWGSSLRNTEDMHSLAESVFSDIRSDSTATRISISNESEKYRSCTAYERAFPERSFALIVTLIFELPTLFLISGGSDRLCSLIGRKKYTTLIAMLPIISAISGNVGLQASTLTTRAISHAQVRPDNYLGWLGKEITAALYLGELIIQ